MSVGKNVEEKVLYIMWEREVGEAVFFLMVVGNFKRFIRMDHWASFFNQATPLTNQSITALF